MHFLKSNLWTPFLTLLFCGSCVPSDYSVVLNTHIFDIQSGSPLHQVPAKVCYEVHFDDGSTLTNRPNCDDEKVVNGYLNHRIPSMNLNSPIKGTPVVTIEIENGGAPIIVDPTLKDIQYLKSNCRKTSKLKADGTPVERCYIQYVINTEAGIDYRP